MSCFFVNFVNNVKSISANNNTQLFLSLLFYYYLFGIDCDNVKCIFFLFFDYFN